MKNICKILSLSFLFPFLSFSFISSAFSFGEYEDQRGNHISFRFLPKESSSGDEEQKLFVFTLVDNYKEIEPHRMKDDFQNHEDVREYIKAYYVKQWDYFINAEHPIKLIHVIKEEKLIGVAIIEQWNDEVETLHLREMAIFPDEQRHGYGTALVEALKNLPEWPVNRIIADTRKFNNKGRQFYKKVGFNECDPHDFELIGTKTHLGLEWKKALQLK